MFNGYFYERLISKNKNVIFIFTGPTGSGKSWCCLSVANKWYLERFKRPFPVENICFTPEKLMERIMHGKLERGELLIIEEAGVMMSSLDFQNKMAKAINYVLQSFRSMNIGLLINLPYKSMLNKTTRNLAHGIVKMVEVMKNEEKAVIKVHLLKYDDNRGKMLNFRPQRVVDGVVVKLDFLHIEKPPESLVEPYEEMKAEFLKNLGEKVIDTLQNSGKKLLTYNQNQILECWKEGISDEKIISEKTGIPKPKVNQNIGYMFKKGYRKEDFLSK